ncbi:hypothetical protein SDC9_111095 [bioreactor metagenome]|uniref:Uncharacterized protein n=1 Tax=bioreactor metagenome TaxID=1076179 RepID=A0A645BFI4_9ZZZZ
MTVRSQIFVHTNGVCVPVSSAPSPGLSPRPVTSGCPTARLGVVVASGVRRSRPRVEELVDLHVVDAREGTRRQGGEQVRVCPGARPGVRPPALGQCRGRPAATGHVGAAGDRMFLRVAAAEPLGVPVRHAETGRIGATRTGPVDPGGAPVGAVGGVGVLVERVELVRYVEDLS